MELTLEIVKLILASIFLGAAYGSEAARRDVDGKENAMLYGSSKDKIHDIQEREGQFGFISIYGAASIFSIMLSNNYIELVIFIVLAAFIAYSSCLYGNYYFQIRINIASGLPRINPDEESTWYSPRKQKEVKKRLWYGKRRIYQRQVAVLLFIVPFLIILMKNIVI